jgi:membrane protein insertase Oxa1/YidC/SpoIIIJ
MFSEIWAVYLYQPLFNALLWIYINIADKNMGWAVVWLTIFLRILLLPLTFISQRNTAKEKDVEDQAIQAAKAFKNDQVAQKEAIRKVMKKNHVSPWAKVALLGFQVLVFVLLYQVFIRGITGEKIIKTLYSFIDFPGKININFYGFNIGQSHDIFWAGLVAIYLFFSIFLTESSGNKKDKSRLTYLFLFPLFTFVILWYLPMVKSLFILTTMVFSDTINVIRKVIFPAKKADAKVASHH